MRLPIAYRPFAGLPDDAAVSTAAACPDAVVLPDGEALCVRPLEPGDRGTVSELFAGLGERSRRLRFHGPRDLDDADLALIASVDQRDRDAVVVFSETSGKPLALGELVRDARDPRAAEIAFAVVDEWQGRGLGRLLADRIARRARCLSVERVRAHVLASNEAALAVVRRVGRVVRSGVDAGSYEVEVEVDGTGATAA